MTHKIDSETWLKANKILPDLRNCIKGKCNLCTRKKYDDSYDCKKKMLEDCLDIIESVVF